MSNLKSWRNQQLQRLKLDSDRMFNQICSEFGLPSVCQPLMDTELRLVETDEGYQIEAELPGVTEDNLELHIDGAYLTLRCAFSEQNDTAESVGSFESQMRLPCKVKLEDVVAKLEDGLLTVKLPTCTLPERRTIPITSGDEKE
ncbi:Hsp20/alpha crystallin family protein [Halodesulfovibrio spirochaetisodalis]|uniref:Molecular chaperone Hsp20 n=1 Tax=Halodesulfovibrio spirochaetisodalis TaxID=1560234 RepID=A0A1B7X9U3_9BACT|nr:Hsp20/alpha crystallin family protein [Halodesulfovibrio spirochaetisodalis]OBQ46102.1 molecular chaperone Hsp20 [Halodesulfovibrio spirochaetisodalis]